MAVDASTAAIASFRIKNPFQNRHSGQVSDERTNETKFPLQ